MLLQTIYIFLHTLNTNSSKFECRIYINFMTVLKHIYFSLEYSLKIER